MPELPEVEFAATVARRIARGRTITSVRVLHRSQRRSLPARDAKSLVGDRILDVRRRGKSQRFALASGRELHVHFRMTGDWLAPGPGAIPRTVRAIITFDDGTSLALDDPRALSVLTLHNEPAGDDGIGPDALDPALRAVELGGRLATRRIPIKVALLDQRIVAGIGNIYASEALHLAGISPRRRAGALSTMSGAPRASTAHLTAAIKRVLTDAIRRVSSRGYRGSRFKVYEREASPCLRAGCGGTIRRFTQAGRSTFYCPVCQR